MKPPKPAFSYSLTRPYPFRYYTLIVVVLFSVLLAPITFITVATSGFQLVTQTSLNPNETVSQHAWNSWVTGLAGNLQATCQPAMISTNAQFFTNNSALTYTMTGVENQTFNASTGTSTQLPSLTNQLSYMNNLFDFCNMDNVSLSFESMSRSPAQLALQKQGLELSTYLECAIAGTYVTLQVTYNYLAGPMVYQFSGRDYFSDSSLFLGETLLRMYWLYTTYVFYQQNMLLESSYEKAWLEFGENYVGSSQGTPYTISSPDFFQVTGQFFNFNAFGAAANNVTVEWAPVSQLLASNNDTILPAIWKPADALAKIFRDTILADLGQSKPLSEMGFYLGNDLLTNASYLEFFTRDFPQMSETLQKAGPGWISLDDDDLPTAPFTSANLSQYNLGISPSTLSMSYICEVPQLKSAGSLFFSVLVADLVILSALWKVFHLISDYILIAKYPEKFKDLQGQGIHIA